MDRDINMGVHAIILNEKNQILLSQRLKKIEYGTYSVPAGHVKENETIEEAVIRELNEELGIIVKEENIEVICVSRNKIYTNFGILIKKYEGEIINKEPENVGILDFFELNNLPTLFKGSEGIINLYKNKKFYDKRYNNIGKD